MLEIIAAWFVCSFVFISSSIVIDANRLNDDRLRIVSKFLTGISFLYLIYLSGLRPQESIGDTVKYLWVYDKINSFESAYETGAALFGNKELFFWPTAYFFKFLGFSGEVWLATSVIIPAIACLYFYSRLVNFSIAALLFSSLTFSYYVVFVCAIRQSYAEALVMLSLALSIKGNVKWSFFYAIVAVGFHQSAFWSLILPFLSRLRFGFSNSVYLLSASVILSVIASDQLLSIFGTLGFSSALEKVQFYASEGGSAEFGNLLHHKQFLILMIFSLIYIFIFRKNEDELYKVIVILFSMIFFFWSMPVMGGRLLGYLTILFPLILYRIISSFCFKYNHTIISVCFSMLGFAVLMNESAQLVLGMDFR